LLARELARDAADIRRANLVAPSATPYRLPTGLSLDSGDFAAGMDAALTRAGYAEVRERQVQLRREGRYLGIGRTKREPACFFAPASESDSNIRANLNI